MALHGIEVPGSEYDCKGPQQYCHQELALNIDPEEHDLLSAQDLQGSGYGYQLQGHIGCDHNQAEGGHHCPYGVAAAVSKADEIAYRSKSMLFGHPDHLSDHYPTYSHGQDRSQVYGQKLQSIRCCPADGAVKGPGGYIDAKGEGIYVGIGHDAPPQKLLPVGEAGYGKEKQQINEHEG